MVSQCFRSSVLAIIPTLILSSLLSSSSSSSSSVVVVVFLVVLKSSFQSTTSTAAATGSTFESSCKFHSPICTFLNHKPVSTVSTVSHYSSVHRRLQQKQKQQQQQQQQYSPTITVATTATTTMQLFSFFSSSSSLSSSSTNLKESTIREFRNKNILITGASSGLGRSLALLLATQCQCHIIILSARSLSTLQSVQKECYDSIIESSSSSQSTTTTTTKSNNPSSSVNQQKRVQIHIVTADLNQPESVQQLAQRALEICSSSPLPDDTSISSSSSSAISILMPPPSKTIDILINNGGVSSRSSFMETDASIDQQMMQINFLAGAQLAKAMIHHHQAPLDTSSTTTQPHRQPPKSPKGRIIWISSVQGKLGIPNRSSYAASKFAVQGYCECIRAELYNDPINVYVHTVSPGYIRTNLSKSALTGTPGILHGQMDPTTERGEDPNSVAMKIINAVSNNQLDIVVAAGLSTYIAIILKLLCPQLLQRIMVQRYQKSLLTKEKTE